MAKWLKTRVKEQINDQKNFIRGLKIINLANVQFLNELYRLQKNLIEEEAAEK